MTGPEMPVPTGESTADVVFLSERVTSELALSALSRVK